MCAVNYQGLGILFVMRNLNKNTCGSFAYALIIGSGVEIRISIVTIVIIDIAEFQKYGILTLANGYSIWVFRNEIAYPRHQ